MLIETGSAKRRLLPRLHELLQPVLYTVETADFAFPQFQNRPASSYEFFAIARVACPVGSYLGSPIAHVCFWLGAELAAVPMPKATMY